MDTFLKKPILSNKSKATNRNKMDKSLRKTTNPSNYEKVEISLKNATNSRVQTDTYKILCQIKNDLPIFNGRMLANECFQWILKLKDLNSAYKLSDNLALELARSRLKGYGMLWWYHYREKINCFLDFENLFCETYLPAVSKKERDCYLFVNLIMIKEDDENLNVYFHKKVRACNKSGLTAKDTLIFILHGLYCDNPILPLIVEDIEEYDDIEMFYRSLVKEELIINRNETNTKKRNRTDLPIYKVEKPEQSIDKFEEAMLKVKQLRN